MPRVKPPGSVVQITYDGDTLNEGDALRTPSGRMYGVLAVRVQTRGKHVGRQYLRVLVLEEEPGAGTRILPLVWYSRDRADRRPAP